MDNFSDEQSKTLVDFGDLKTNFALLKLEVSKEIEFIKQRISLFIK